MGVDQVTIQNLDIVKVDADLNLIAVRGAFPVLRAVWSSSRAPLRPIVSTR